jgi:hypothetical protein
MSRKRAKRLQAQKPLPPLSAETLETIQAAVFLYEDEPVIGLGKIDEVHGRRADSAGRIFRRYRNSFIEGIHFFSIKRDASPTKDASNDLTVSRRDTNQNLDLTPDNLTVSRRDKHGVHGGYRGEVTLFYKKGYLAVSDSFSDPLDGQIQGAVTKAFDDLLKQAEKDKSIAHKKVIFSYNNIEIRINSNEQICAQDMYLASGVTEQKAPLLWLQNPEIQGVIASGSKFSENRQVIEFSPNGRIWLDQDLAVVYAAYLDLEFHLFAFRQLRRGWAESKLAASPAGVPIAEAPSAPAVFPAEFERFGAKLDDMMALLQREAQENRQDLLAIRQKLSGEIDAARGEVAAVQGQVSAARSEVVLTRESVSGERARVSRSGGQSGGDAGAVRPGGELPSRPEQASILPAVECGRRGACQTPEGLARRRSGHS